MTVSHNLKDSPSRENGSLYSHSGSSNGLELNSNANGEMGSKSRAWMACAEEISSDDIIIAVVGPTGSGKSTFVSAATGMEIAIGHELESCTADISIIKLSDRERSDNDIVFIDTPGFDTLQISEEDTLKQVSNWLKTTFTVKVRLSGLLYFHRISNNRKNGYPHQKFSTFKRLVCTEESFKNIILVTTAWDEIEDEATGNLREEQLKVGYWQPMISQGSRIGRFMGTRESAFRLLEPFIDQANKRLKSGSSKSSDTTRSDPGANGKLGTESPAQIACIEEVDPDDIIIAVVGPTGSGKSTFIRAATGVELAIGHELELCTRKMIVVKFSGRESSDHNIVFIDTPGFDTLYESEADVLKRVSDWLKTTSKAKVQLSGLLYFHRISDNRKNGSPHHKTPILKHLVRTESFKDITLVTTAWDEIEDEATGNSREEQLKVGYWQPMINQGSRIERFKKTRESSFQILEPFIEQANARLKLARNLERRRATDRLRSEITILGQKQQKLLQEISNELKDPDGHGNLQTLRKEYEDLKSTSIHLLDTMSTFWETS